MTKRNKSFSNRLSWRIIGIVSAIFFMAMVIVAIVSHKIIADEATRSAQHILRGTISELEKPLSEVEISTQSVAAYMSAMQDQPQALQAIASRTVEVSRLINGCAILFLRPDGSIDHSRPAIFSYRDDNGIHDFHPSGNQLQKFTTFWDTKRLSSTKTPFWTTPHPASDSRTSKLATYCYPLVDSALRVYAVVAADMAIDQIENTVEGLRPYDNAITALIFDEKNIAGIKRSDSDLINRYRRSFLGSSSFENLVEDFRSKKDSMRRSVGKGREISFVVYGPLHNGWMLSITCPYHDVLRRSSQMHISLIIIGLIGLAVIFFSCRKAIQRMTRPVTELSEAALAMAKGDFKTKLPEISSHDELMHLRDSFTYMQNSIATYIEELKTSTAANERMESELNVARNIQMGMLRTDFPPQFHAMLIPAKEVGGDLYDFALRGDQLYFAIGDVSGKGVPAALMMAITRSALRFVAGTGLPLNETLTRINNGVCDANSRDMFVTLFVGRINLKTRHLDYCNAGHNPLVVIPKNGEPYFLKAMPNIAVGLFADFPYVEESIDFDAETRIFAYTDGVTEAENGRDEFFGEDRLMEWCRQLSPATDPKTADESLLDTVRAFADGFPQNDDITILNLIV